MVVCLELSAELHMAQLMPLPLTVSCFSKIQIGFTILVPAHLGSPGKKAVRRVCVCVCVSSCRVSLADGCSPLSIARKSAVKTVTVDLLCCCCIVPVHLHFSSLNSMTNTIIFHACFRCDTSLPIRTCI